MPIPVLGYLLLLMSSAFAAGAVFKKFRQPPVVGYLVAGLILGLVLSRGNLEAESINFLSELGVVLLLFTLGLEFPLARMKAVGRGAILGAILQIILTILFLTNIAAWFGFDFFTAIYLAAAFSLSSTAVVVKLLSDRGETDTLPGEILITWLVIQDLSVLPMIVIMPQIGKQMASGGNLYAVLTQVFINLVWVGMVLAAVILVGKRLVPKFLKKIAALNSRELLLVAVFTTIVFGALFSQIIGLSAGIGAFLTGILIARSAQNHAVFTEIRPLRDLFALIFFVTLGLIIPSGFFISHLGTIIILTVAVLVVKFIIVLCLSFYLGYHSHTSFIVSFGLINVGEFAFILAKTGLNSQILSADAYAICVSVALLSVLISPPLFINSRALYTRLRAFAKNKYPPLYFRLFRGLDHHDTLPELPFSKHVVLCGYGRVGKYIGRALSMSEIPYLVVEYDQAKVNHLKSKGITAIFGDPSDIDVLDLAQVDKARAVVVAVPDSHTQQMVVLNSRKLNRNIRIYCRTHRDEDREILKKLGVDDIIHPEFEASLSVTDKILKLFGLTDKEIGGRITRLKIEHGMG